MTFAVRALSLSLTVWLTAASAFPPCCWSMARAHHHQAQQHAVARAVQSHSYHHHGGMDSGALTAAAHVMSASPAHDCDTALAEAVATPRTLLSFVALRTASASSADFIAPKASARRVALSDFAPPGASAASAFLNPLRI